MNRNLKSCCRTYKFVFAGLLICICNLVYAQTNQPDGKMSLRDLLELAELNFPSIAVRQAEADAAQANVRLSKNTLMPSLDAAYQANYASYNNITGMNLPGQLIPISGPPSTENFSDAVPGTAASLLLRWTPITFGQRAAAIEHSRSLYEKGLASIEDEVLNVKFTVAFLYLEIAATNELIHAYQKNIERTDFNLHQVSTLVAAGLRPSVDSLKFRGELSKSKTEFLKLKNLKNNQIQQLLELIVVEDIEDIALDERFVEKLPYDTSSMRGVDALVNPQIKMAQIDLRAAQANQKQISRSWTPVLEFWGTTYARGSGIDFNGIVNKPEGWSFSRYNYGAGVQLVFPILDLSNLKIKNSIQDAYIRYAENNLHQIQNSMHRKEIIAGSTLFTSLEVAKEVPTEYQASESAYKAIQRKYSEGLIDYTELIQTQYDLLNAEARLKNAYITAWKSLLELAVIKGDINIFLNQIQN